MIESKFLNNEVQKIFYELNLAKDSLDIEYRNDKQEMIVSLMVSIEVKDWLEEHPNFVKVYWDGWDEDYTYVGIDDISSAWNGMEDMVSIDFLFILNDRYMDKTPKEQQEKRKDFCKRIRRLKNDANILWGRMVELMNDLDKYEELDEDVGLQEALNQITKAIDEIGEGSNDMNRAYDATKGIFD